MNEEEERAVEFHLMSDFRHYAQNLNAVLYFDEYANKPVRVVDLVDKFMSERYS